ncbi:class I SAM-dependent methyltransferase [Candidatus Enterococcus ferrettii]|uniref:Methyltransferase domain-containing protein n=1 Tax=Candidatus Enterococcus ferrettii TaxID=2815324 RepID=A0ABV0EWY8_9ENTE|nr:methyltransferase domain-containing protein [Enterococcus sp. 665A]MBO1342609.1 methyltransferase domain-containing protein [Enterococcus sp. 665A]
MEWNAQNYQKNHDFVFQYGADLLELLPKSSMKILDVGCGTGELSHQMTELGHQVLGIDASPNMIQQAQAQFPGENFQVANALTFETSQPYDVLFSNAALHWITDHEKLLSQFQRLVNVEGLLICEFGGAGNVRKLTSAFQAELEKLGKNYQSPFYFPSCKQYQPMLEAHGFHVHLLQEYDRPTPLKGSEGLRNWLKQFFASDLAALSEVEQERILSEVEATLEDSCWKETYWEADYHRIRIVAEKK